MLNMLRGAALFHSRDIDELAEALSDEDTPPHAKPRGKVHRLPPNRPARDGQSLAIADQKAG